MGICFLFSWPKPESEFTGSYGKCKMFYGTASLPKWLYHFIVPSAVYDSPNSSTALVCVISSYYDMCVKESCDSFNLHFSNG